MSTEKAEPFEKSFKELEDVVGRLESGGLGLDEAIALYEQGMKLAKECQDSLDRAELRITRLRETYLDEGGGAAEPDNDV
ncbi:MAG: exodeoxyribonuclease VII small subunit [Dehalococcoidia bacterium]|nr:exodeoxyribonuclease VII small subunit [Dehalococcoidia bacterium]